MIYALDINKDVIWNYNISEKILGVQIINIGSDRNDIFLFTAERIYEINTDGELEYIYDPGLVHDIDDVIIDYLEKENTLEFIINSDRNVYVFDVNWTKITEEKTKPIQTRIEDSRVDSKDKKKALAGHYYQKAKYCYSISLYELAGLYLRNASGIYMGIKDSEGIAKCNLLTEKIDDAVRSMTSIETTTTLPPHTSSTILSITLVTGDGNSILGIPAMFAALVLLVILIMVVSLKESFVKKRKKEEDIGKKRRKEEELAKWVESRLRGGEDPELLKKALERQNSDPTIVDEITERL